MICLTVNPMNNVSMIKAKLKERGDIVVFLILYSTFSESTLRTDWSNIATRIKLMRMINLM